MHVASLNFDFRARSVEILVFQFALHAAVDRVGEVGPECLDVEVIDAASDLLIGREADADFAVFHFGVGQQVFGRCHDLRYTGFVVGA